VTTDREIFDSDYYQWKRSISGTKFGHRTKKEDAYFSAELKKANINIELPLSVIEIGYGNGAFLGFCVDKHWAVLGVEANPVLVNEGREAGFNCVHGFNLDSNLSGSADLIVLFDVLEHVPSCDLIHLMQNISRVLKKDGIFLARFPNGDSPLGLVYQNGDITHVSAIGRDAIRQIGFGAKLRILYCGSQSSVFGGSSVRAIIHMLLRWPILKIVNCILNYIFFPAEHYELLAPNLVVIMKKNEVYD
jgi:SAM-dependent methyltransferase